MTFVDSADRRANVYTELDCTGDGVQPCSYCTGDKAVLVLTWKPLGGSDEIDDRFLSFNFGAVSVFSLPYAWSDSQMCSV